MTETVVTVETREEGNDWLAVAAAIAFAVLFVVAMMLVVPYDTDQDDAALLADLDDSKALMTVGVYAGVLAGLAFLIVAATFVRRLSVAFSERNLAVARGAAIVATVGLVLGPAIAGSPGVAEIFGDQDRPVEAALARFIPHVGFVTLMIVGALAIALFLGVLARTGQRSRLLPGWFVILSYVTVGAMILAPMFIPLILLPVWAIGAAVVLAKPAPAA